MIFFLGEDPKKIELIYLQIKKAKPCMYVGTEKNQQS